jgi:magnesium transporter
VLTLIATIMLPLTLVTGIFGMNVLFPGEGSSTAFWVAIGIMGAISAGSLGFFRWKRWL